MIKDIVTGTFNSTSRDSSTNANNRSNQMNPNNPAYRFSRGKGRR
jgi:hypothetical protein